MAPGQGVVHVVAVVQVEPFLGAEPVPETAQLDGIRFLVTEQRIRRLFPGRFGPQLVLARVHVSHFQMIQSDFHAVPGALVRPDGERLALRYTQRTVENDSQKLCPNYVFRTGMFREGFEHIFRTVRTGLNETTVARKCR